MAKPPHVFAFDKMPLEKLSDKVSHRSISGRNITLTHFEIKKGGGVPLHHHPNEQISYILKGKMKVTSEGKEFLVLAGEVIQVPPNTPHVFEAMEDCVVIALFSPPKEHEKLRDSH